VPEAGDERDASTRPGLGSDRARELARLSARRRRRLSLADVEAALPPALDTPERIRAALELVQRWACAGLLAGSVAGSAVRAAEAALKLYEAQLDRERLKALERRVRELERELAQRPRLGRVP
jgi:hypothetical protein